MWVLVERIIVKGLAREVLNADKGKKKCSVTQFPKKAHRYYMCLTIGSWPFMASPMGFQLVKHWFLAPYVFNHSNISCWPHMCSMIASQPYLKPCTIQDDQKLFFSSNEVTPWPTTRMSHRRWHSE